MWSSQSLALRISTSCVFGFADVCQVGPMVSSENVAKTHHVVQMRWGSTEPDSVVAALIL